MPDEELDHLVDWIYVNCGGQSREAAGAAASNVDLYQVNCTFFDALARDEHRYLADFAPSASTLAVLPYAALPSLAAYFLQHAGSAQDTCKRVHCARLRVRQVLHRVY